MQSQTAFYWPVGTNLKVGGHDCCGTERPFTQSICGRHTATNVSFTKTVAVYLNEAGPFALRNSIMDDTEAMELS